MFNIAYSFIKSCVKASNDFGNRQKIDKEVADMVKDYDRRSREIKKDNENMKKILTREFLNGLISEKVPIYTRDTTGEYYKPGFPKAMFEAKNDLYFKGSGIKKENENMKQIITREFFKILIQKKVPMYKTKVGQEVSVDVGVIGKVTYYGI